MKELAVFSRLVGAWVAGAALLAGVAAASDTTLAGPHASDYTRAYEAITQEQVVDGATELLDFFRELPADDVRLTQTTLGHAHLLWFATTRLMWRGERHRFYLDNLQGEQIRIGRPVTDSPTDALLRSGLELKHMEYGAHMLVQSRLRSGARTGHEAVSAASWFALGFLHHYRGDFTDDPGPRMLVERYPELELSRSLVEIPVLEALRLARNPEQSLEFRDEYPGTLMRMRRSRRGPQPDQDRSLFQYSLFGERGEARSVELSPGLRAVADALPSMHTQDIDEGVIASWSERLEQGELDPAARYLLTGVLAAACTNTAERDAARPGLEAVAALPPTTADVLRAQIALIHFARAEHDVHEMSERVRQLTALRVLPSAPDFNPYIEVIEAVRLASDYFMRYGHIGMAVRTHEACGAMFPGTPLAHAELRRAELLKREDARVSIARVQALADNYMHNSQQFVGSSPPTVQDWRDLAQAMLEDIIAHSAHAGVRDAAAARLDRLDDVMPSPPPSPPRGSVLAVWNATFIQERNAHSPAEFQRDGSGGTFLDLIQQRRGN